MDQATKRVQEETIGQRIRRLRGERGISQRGLAGPGVTAAYISRIEKGERVPSVKAIRVIARKLGVSPEHLESGHDMAAADRLDLGLVDAELELRFASNPGEARQKFERLLAEAHEAGDPAGIARAATGLGLACSQLGEFDRAIELLEALAQGAEELPQVNPDVIAALARAYRFRGRESEAVEAFERAMGSLGPSDRNSPLGIRLATFMSQTLTEVGDTTRAREVLDEALENAVAPLPENLVNLYWTRARLAVEEGEPTLARAYITRGMAAFEQMEDTLHVRRAHLLFTEALLAEGRFDDARERIAIAESVLGEGAPIQVRAWMTLLRAQALLGTGEYAEARSLLEAADLSVASVDFELRARMYIVLGEASWRDGDHGAAANAFERAREIAPPEANGLLLSLYATWSEMLESDGRLAEALSMARQAAALASPPHA